MLSLDLENDPDMVAMVAASAALTLSGIPFMGPIGAARVGYIGGNYVLNPQIDEMTRGAAGETPEERLSRRCLRRHDRQHDRAPLAEQTRDEGSAIGSRLRGMDRRFALVLLATLCVTMLPLTWEDRRVVWIVMALLLGFFWVLRAVAPDPERLMKLLSAWRVMTMLNATIAVTGQLGLTNFSAPNAENRQAGFFDQPNEFAGLLVIGIPLFVLGVPRTKEYATDGQELFARAWRTAFVVYALATTGSMTNILAASVGLLVALAAGGWRHMRRPGKAYSSPLLPMVVLLVGALGIVALANSDLPVVDRFARYTSGDNYVTGSVNERKSLNADVTNNFDQLLVVGRGFSSVTFDDRGRDDSKDNLATHNMHLLLLLQAGLPALVALICILGFTASHGMVFPKGDALQERHRAPAGAVGVVVRAAVPVAHLHRLIHHQRRAVDRRTYPAWPLLELSRGQERLYCSVCGHGSERRRVVGAGDRRGLRHGC